MSVLKRPQRLMLSMLWSFLAVGHPTGYAAVRECCNWSAMCTREAKSSPVFVKVDGFPFRQVLCEVSGLPEPVQSKMISQTQALSGLTSRHFAMGILCGDVWLRIFLIFVANWLLRLPSNCFEGMRTHCFSSPFFRVF